MKLQVVLSSAFSPTHWLLATGCLSGRLAWHQPVIWSAPIPVLLFVLWDSYFRLHVQILFVFITDSFCWQALPSSSCHHNSYQLVLPSICSTCSCHVIWPKWILTDISEDDSSTASALICQDWEEMSLMLGSLLLAGLGRPALAQGIVRCEIQRLAAD